MNEHLTRLRKAHSSLFYATEHKGGRKLLKNVGPEDCGRMHIRVFFPPSSSFLLAFVKLLKSTKEEAGSNDRIGKWFSSGLTAYVCVCVCVCVCVRVCRISG